MIKFIRNISPFNNKTEMPAGMLVVKKLLAFILCFLAGTLSGNFCLSSVPGLNLSSEGSSAALIDMKNVGENLLNGGKYGTEASIITVVIIAVSAAVTGYMTIYKNRQED